MNCIWSGNNKTSPHNVQSIWRDWMSQTWRENHAILLAKTQTTNRILLIVQCPKHRNWNVHDQNTQQSFDIVDKTFLKNTHFFLIWTFESGILLVRIAKDSDIFSANVNIDGRLRRRAYQNNSRANAKRLATLARHSLFFGVPLRFSSFCFVEPPEFWFILDSFSEEYKLNDISPPPPKAKKETVHNFFLVFL